MGTTRWADSADKHGIDRADALHAMRNARVVIAAFGPSRIPGGPPVTLYIGPMIESAGMLEVLAVVDKAAQGVYIFHVMPLRPSMYARAKAVIQERKDQR